MIFTVDSQCVYRALPLRSVMLACQILLLLLIAIYAVVSMFRSHAEKRGKYRTLALFGLLMAVLLFLQIWFPLLPLYTIAYMLGTCLLHTFVVNEEKAAFKRGLEEAAKDKQLKSTIESLLNNLPGMTFTKDAGTGAYLAILWANMTSLPLFARFFLGDLFRFGFCYTIFGYQVWLGEALLSMCALLLIGLLLLVPSLLPFHAVATESYALFIIWSVVGLIYFRTLLRRDRHNEHEQRLVVWAFLLILILFAAMMWVSRHTEIAANDAVDRIYAYHQAHPEHDSSESQEERSNFLREQAKSVSSTNTLYTMVSLGLFLVIFTMLLNNFLGDSRHGQGGRKENPDHRADSQRL